MLINWDIFLYMGPTVDAMCECQPVISGVACRCVYKLVHHAQAYVVSTPGERAEHPGYKHTGPHTAARSPIWML